MTVQNITRIYLHPVKEADIIKKLSNDTRWRAISITTSHIIFESETEISSTEQTKVK